MFVYQRFRAHNSNPCQNREFLLYGAYLLVIQAQTTLSEKGLYVGKKKRCKTLSPLKYTPLRRNFDALAKIGSVLIEIKRDIDIGAAAALLHKMCFPLAGLFTNRFRSNSTHLFY